MSPGSQASPSKLRQTELSVALAVFVTVFATGSRLGRLPLRSLIKDELGLPPEAMAEFFAIVGLAWYIKPLAGAMSDQLPLAGSRRKHYLVVSACGGALTWLVTCLVPISFAALAAALATLNMMAVLGNSVAGGLIVDAGREHQATGRLSALRVLAMNTGSLIIGPIGGWLAARAFALTCLSGAALMATMAIGVALLMDPDRVKPADNEARRSVQLRELIRQFGRRRVWASTLFASAIYLTPSLSTTFYYFQREGIGFSDQTIGLLGSLNCLGGMLGAYVYLRVSSDLRLRQSIVAGVGLCALRSLSYLAYGSLSTALIVEPIAGFCFILGIMPIHELSARASPPAHEAFVFAAILAVCNAAIAVSDILGTRLVADLGLSLDQLILVNAASLVAALALLPLVPAELLERESKASPPPSP